MGDLLPIGGIACEKKPSHVGNPHGGIMSCEPAAIGEPGYVSLVM